MCLCGMWMHTCYGALRKQLCGVGSLFPQWVLGLQLWLVRFMQQVSSLSGLSCWPTDHFQRSPITRYGGNVHTGAHTQDLDISTRGILCFAYACVMCMWCMCRFVYPCVNTETIGGLWISCPISFSSYFFKTESCTEPGARLVAKKPQWSSSV